jgi:uncharacterized protein DUF2630
MLRRPGVSTPNHKPEPTVDAKPADVSVHDIIRHLIDEERVLRAARSKRVGDPAAQMQRLQDLDVELDRCWDLLRERRALRTADVDPEGSHSPDRQPGQQLPPTALADGS